MSDYLIHYGIQGQKWGVRRFQNEDGTLTPEGIRRYSDLIDKSKTSDKYKKKLEKFERDTDAFGNHSRVSKYNSVKENIRASKRFDYQDKNPTEYHDSNAAHKRKEGKNPINDIKKYVNTSLATANKLVNGDTGEEAQKVIQRYMDVHMDSLNYILWEVGDFNSELDKPSKYNNIDYSYDVKNKKLHQKKWKNN